MNDLERELRDLLADDAQHVPTPDRAPESLRRRAHLRQATFATLTGLSVVAVVALAVVALSALPSRDAGLPADQPTTTQALNGITITYPGTWHLIDPDDAGLNGPDPTEDLPRLVLALSPQPPSEMLACPGLVEGDAPTFLMTVQETPLALTGDAASPWPVSLEPMDLGDATGSACYPAWGFLHARWSAEGRTFEGVVGLDPGIGDEDREALFAAFASMTFEPVSAAPTSAVLATGTAGGEDWELIASSDADGLSLALQTDTSGTGTGGFGADPAITVASHVFGEGDQAELVVFGAVPADAVRLVATDATFTETEVPILDVPDTIDPRLNAFVVTIDPERSTTFEAFDAQGELLADGSIGPEPGEPTAPPELALEDGRHFGYVRSVDPDGRTIDFDLAIWLTGEEANRAYQEATGDTGPVPNDYYVVNDNPKLRTLPLATDLRLRLLDWNDCCDTFFDANLALFAEAIRTEDFVIDADGHRYDARSQWWLTVEDGVVTEIEEQYAP